jgi:acyl carrier protein
MSQENALELVKAAFLFATGDGATAAKITVDSHVDELGLESIASLEMAGYLEDRLGRQFPDEELFSLRCVRDFVNIITKYQSAAAALA